MMILNPSRWKNAAVVTDVMFTINGNLIADGWGFTNSGATLVWTIDDGGVITQLTQNSTPAYTLVNATASVIVSSADNFAFVTQITLRNQNILNELDFRVLTEVEGQIQVDGNSSLTSLKTPVNNNLITLIRAYGCNLTGIVNLSSLSTMVSGIELYNNANLSGLVLNSNTSALSFSLYSCGLSGILDISNIAGIQGVLAVNNNASLTGLALPSSSAIVTSIQAYLCNLTGTLDLSMLTHGLSGSMRFYSNSNLTNITFAPNTFLISQLWGYLCNLTGTLDLSMLTGGFTSVTLRSNPNLTQILFPTTSALVNQLDIYSCNLTGTLDLSGLTGLGGSPHRYYLNPNLTNIIFPSTTRTFGSLQVYSCNLGYIDLSVMPNMLKINAGVYTFQNNAMTAAEVNHILYDLSILALTETAGGDFTGRSINISGTNAAPDSSSGGFNGTQAVIDLQAQGVTVTTS